MRFFTNLLCFAGAIHLSKHHKNKHSAAYSCTVGDAQGECVGSRDASCRDECKHGHCVFSLHLAQEDRPCTVAGMGCCVPGAGDHEADEAVVVAPFDPTAITHTHAYAHLNGILMPFDQEFKAAVAAGKLDGTAVAKEIVAAGTAGTEEQRTALDELVKKSTRKAITENLEYIAPIRGFMALVIDYEADKANKRAGLINAMEAMCSKLLAGKEYINLPAKQYELIEKVKDELLNAPQNYRAEGQLRTNLSFLVNTMNTVASTLTGPYQVALLT
jgi:hypothetical protein